LVTIQIFLLNKKTTMKKVILNSFVFSFIFGGMMLLFYFVAKAWSPDTNWLTAQSGDALTADKWNKLVPSKTIIAIYDTTCPEWWKPADGTNSTPDLRGQFLRWLNTFDNWTTTRSDGNQDPDGSARTLWNYQADQLKLHNHKLTTNGLLMILYNNWHSVNQIWNVSWWRATRINMSSYNSADTWWNETRGKNIAVIYCMKQ